MINTPRVIDITELTDKVVESLQPKAVEKGLSLNFTPTAQRSLRTFTPLYFVNQDADHLREILDNLVENAIKYTPQGAVTVDISSVTEDKVVVSVKDSGLGIPAEDVPHLFQKFYRVNNVDRQSIGGTGLGLYLSRRLAEAMQGRMWVESVYQKGSTFFLELPRITNEEAERLKIQQVEAPAPVYTPQATAAPVIDPVTVAQPVMEPLVAAAIAAPEKIVPAPTVTPPTPQPVPSPPTRPQPVAPVTQTAAPNVPRGQNLTREQIAERVRQLEAMARATRPAERAANERK
jgi:anti-sigma regulatory factor (Ser/Thr protein kinase)